LRGRLLVEKRNKTDLLIARELFQQAINKDKTFANAYSGLADTCLLSSFRGYEDPVKMLWIAKKNIDTALTLDPSSGETHASLGYWYHQTFDWHAAEITYRKIHCAKFKPVQCVSVARYFTGSKRRAGRSA
jgi:Tfp pilus assembly protein PilF